MHTFAGSFRYSRSSCIAIWLLLVARTCVADDVPVTVGVEGRMEALLPAKGLQAAPASRNSPITIRIASTRPHGTLVRYDLRFIGLVPGKYDLRNHLLRDDGTTANDLPALPVTVGGLLPADHNGHLASSSESRSRPFWRYKWLLAGVAAIWAVLAVPLFRGRRQMKTAESIEEARPPTLIERLRPLVAQASEGRLTAADKAHLERLLLLHWSDRLELGAVPISEALPRLRQDPEAGALLRALEDWLHRPPGTAQVDVEAVLAPYAENGGEPNRVS